MKRLCLLALHVRPELVIVDGENLTKFRSGSSEIPAADLDGFVEKLRSDIAETEKQINAGEDTTAALREEG